MWNTIFAASLMLLLSISLRERPLCGVNLLNTAGTYPHTTGTQISIVDAEFLTRESAKAD
jgi:hypothetical protein